MTETNENVGKDPVAPVTSDPLKTDKPADSADNPGSSYVNQDGKSITDTNEAVGAIVAPPSPSPEDLKVIETANEKREAASTDKEVKDIEAVLKSDTGPAAPFEPMIVKQTTDVRSEKTHPPGEDYFKTRMSTLDEKIPEVFDSETIPESTAKGLSDHAGSLQAKGQSFVDTAKDEWQRQAGYAMLEAAATIAAISDGQLYEWSDEEVEV